MALALCGVCAGVAQASDPLGYVASEQAGTIRQVDLATGALGAPIAVGSKPVGVAISPDGAIAYVADYGSSEIVPVALATGTVGAPIVLSDRPAAIAILPNGKTAYVVSDSGREWPITLTTGHLGNPSTIPVNSDALAITPAGITGYLTNVADGTLTPVTLSNWGTGEPINLAASTPDAVAITPDGSTAYVASNSGGTITPVNLSNGTSGTAIQAGSEPTSIAISSDGSTAYVTDFGTGLITPITLATAAPGTPITVGPELSAIALVPPGGITTAPPGTYGTGSGSASGSTNGTPVTTLGNQQLTLTLSQATGTNGSAQACHASKTTLGVTLKRRTLRHGAKLKLRYVTFRLGKQAKRVQRLPATVRFPLKGYKPGSYTVNVRVSYTETVIRATSRRRKLTTVTISRTLKARFTVC
jgi:DNA-binding beta-propeller fold protein YncE